MEKEAKLELEKNALQKSQMNNFENPLQPKTDLVKNSLLSTNQNHDAQNNVNTSSKSSIPSNTCSENAPPVTCIVRDDLEDCETKEELFACFRKQIGLS